MHHLNFFSPETEMSADIPPSTEKKSLVVFVGFLFETLSVVLNPRQSLRLRSQFFHHSHLLEQVYFPVHLNKLFPHIRLSRQKHGDTEVKFVWSFSDPGACTTSRGKMEVPRTGGPVGKGKKKRKIIVTIGFFLFASIRIHIFISIIKNQQLKK